MTFSPKSNALILSTIDGGSTSGSLRFETLTHGRQENVLWPRASISAAFSPNGKFLASIDYAGAPRNKSEPNDLAPRLVHLWNWRSGMLLRAIPLSSDHGGGLVFATNDRLYVGDGSSVIAVDIMKHGRFRERTYSGFEWGYVCSVAALPHGRIAAISIASDAGTAELAIWKTQRTHPEFHVKELQVEETGGELYLPDIVPVNDQLCHILWGKFDFTLDEKQHSLKESITSHLVLGKLPHSYIMCIERASGEFLVARGRHVHYLKLGYRNPQLVCISRNGQMIAAWFSNIDTEKALNKVIIWKFH